MGSHVLSVRDFSIIYNIVQGQIARMEEPLLDFFKNEVINRDEEKRKRKEELSDNLYYQDLIRIRESIGNLNITIETPSIEVK